MKDPVLIVGAGAMACLFAGQLVRAGYPVTMLDDWEAGIRALQREGVRLVYPDGAEEVYPVHATSTPHDCRGAHYAVVVVKSWQTGRAAEQLSSCLAPDGLAVSIQNGLGNYEQLVQWLGSERSAAGVTTLGATLLEPGKVRIHSHGEIVLGHHPRLPAILDILAESGFQVRSTPDFTGLLWGKLVVNAAINPLTTLLEVPNGALLELPGTVELLHHLIAETVSVAAALGITLPFEDPHAEVERVIRLTAGNISSTLQDRRRGAPTEIDAISGAVTRWGEECGVATPYNRSMWRLVQACIAAQPGRGRM